MAEKPTSEGFDFRPWWMKVDRVALRKELSLLAKFDYLKGDKPLPPWTEQDIQKFAEEDPTYGHQVLLARRASLYNAYGAAAGGLCSAAFTYSVSKSVGGALLLLLIGSATSYAVTGEATNVALGLYKFDTWAANKKFLAWWAAKHSQ